MKMAKQPIATELDDEDEIEGADAAGQVAEGEGDEGSEGEGAADDEGGEGSEPEAGEGGDVDDDQAAAPPSRGETRLQRLANENRRLREQLAAPTRAAPAQPLVQAPQEETEEAFRARIALLPPDERMDARLERSERRNAHQMRMMALQSADQTDKATYDAKAVTDGRYKRYAADVEAKRQELLNLGQIVPREAVLKFLIGERVLERQGSADARRQRADGQARVARQTVRPSGARSDVQGSRRTMSEADKRRQRLENTEI